MSETSLVVRMPSPTVWQMIEQIAPSTALSGFFSGVQSPAKAAAIMLKGWELGLPLAASFEFIHVIQNKLALSPRGALAIIQNSGAIEVKITRLANGDYYLGHECWMKRKSNSFEYTSRFTLKDASRAGLVRPDSGWEKYPENMCLWRCVGFTADVVCSDLIGGLKRADEYGAPIDMAGNVIEGEWSTPTAETQTATESLTVISAGQHTTVESGAVSQTKQAITLDQLLEQYGPDQVLEAAGGVIPATDEDVDRVAAILQVL